MLGFFRKYQKFFFIFITVIIVISFTFFGTFSSFVSRQGQGKIDEKVVLTYLLNEVNEEGKMPLLLNDGVVRKDFLSTQVGTILAEKYFAELKPGLEEKLKKAQNYKPYNHSVEKIWDQVLPVINVELKSLKEVEEVTPEVFSKLASLYVAQDQFPPQILKRFLLYQKQDPLVQNADLSIFGYHSLEQWFGKEFLEIASQFILDVAAVAEKRGYKVTTEEARNDLYHNIYVGVKRLTKEEVDLAEMVQHQIQAFGVDEGSLVRAWKKVLLFRHLYNEAGNAIFVDPLFQEQFASFANETAHVEQYQLPEYLRLRDFRSLLKLQVYIDAVSKGKNSLLLPKDYLTPDEIERRTPELVQRTFLVEYGEVKKEDLGLRTTLKEVWDWELQDANWPVLAAQFPALAGQSSQTREEKFSILEALEPKRRLEIDKYARSKIIDLHPEWIDQALATAEMKNEKISIRGKASRFPFVGTDDAKEVLSFLLSDKTQVSFDQNHFYKVNVIEKPTQKVMLTFKEASEDGTLKELLDRKLEEAEDKEGTKLYAELLKAIRDDFVKTTNKEVPPGLDFYANHRLYAFIREAQKNPSPVDSQWSLVKTETDILRGDATGKEELFTLNEGSWSNIHFSPQGDLSFSKLLSRGIKEEKENKKIVQAKSELAMEAKRLLTQNLIKEIDVDHR